MASRVVFPLLGGLLVAAALPLVLGEGWRYHAVVDTAAGHAGSDD